MTFERVVWKISDLIKAARDSLERNFSDILVVGEIGDLSQPGSGHYYFTLKDEKAQIKAVLFRFQSRYLGFPIKSGIQVIARGKISVYEQRGEMQLVCSYLEPLGLGLLQIELDSLKAELAAAGYFDHSRKKAIPILPKKIGVVTSLDGAALYDILRKIYERMPGQHVLVNPAQVQGKGASEQIAQAIIEIVKYGNCDVIIVARGGGSFEDLYAFNERPVCDAIYRSPIPIITGIGHEVDWTLADMIADLRATTPTAAAEAAVLKRADLYRIIGELSHRVSSVVESAIEKRFKKLDYMEARLFRETRIISESMQTLDMLYPRLQKSIRTILTRNQIEYKYCRNRLAVNKPDFTLQKNIEMLASLRKKMQRASLVILENHQTYLTALDKRMKIKAATCVRPLEKEMINLDRRLRMHMNRNLENKWQIISGYFGKLDSLSPLAVLGRGYSLVSREGEKTFIRDASVLHEGEMILIQFHKGRARAEVRKP